MSLRRLFVAAALVMPLGTAAHAQSIPRYDVEAHCREVASFGGEYSASLDETCFDMEQSAYEGLRDAWAGLPASMRGHCDEVASFGGAGSYSLLSTCVEMETSASESVSGRSFQY